MRAMSLRRPAPVETHPLALVERPLPDPGPDEVRVAVELCGVCRTDLHVVEGDLASRRAGIVPGHQVVGRVAGRGASARRFREGDRVGVAWLRRACGTCRFCASGRENLCLAPQFTGWDADGGYADAVTVPEAFAYPLPATLGPREAAPLLCAGIIGYRAFVRSGVRPGGRLGLYGFGGSAHIVIQIARHHGCEVFVVTRGGVHRDLAQELGAAWVGEAHERPPAPLDAAILFAPAGELVPVALAALDRGGTLAVAGIHLSAIPSLDYQAHLFEERALVSVTANTRSDGEALLALAAEIPIRTHTRSYPLEQANQALVDLKQDRVRGSALLEVGSQVGVVTFEGDVREVAKSPDRSRR
jgi:propanol-preferring alcohol dehydrogenase